MVSEIGCLRLLALILVISFCELGIDGFYQPTKEKNGLLTSTDCVK
jgi:hypothetical protein